MAYVLVEAAEFERARSRLKDELQDDIEPVVPELPEGADLHETNDIIYVIWTDDHTYGVDELGLHCCTCPDGPMPHDVATYLLARWQSLQGGA
jgi:hypothetical protein